jgi:hypothetical protein
MFSLLRKDEPDHLPRLQARYKADLALAEKVLLTTARDYSANPNDPKFEKAFEDALQRRNLRRDASAVFEQIVEPPKQSFHDASRGVAEGVHLRRVFKDLKLEYVPETTDAGNGERIVKTDRWKLPSFQNEYTGVIDHDAAEKFRAKFSSALLHYVPNCDPAVELQKLGWRPGKEVRV